MYYLFLRRKQFGDNIVVMVVSAALRENGATKWLFDDANTIVFLERRGFDNTDKGWKDLVTSFKNNDYFWVVEKDRAGLAEIRDVQGVERIK